MTFGARVFSPFVQADHADHSQQPVQDRHGRRHSLGCKLCAGVPVHHVPAVSTLLGEEEGDGELSSHCIVCASYACASGN